MRRVRLRPRAIADLAEIRRYTRKIWGPAQADKYLQKLGAQLEKIAEGTAAVRDAEIRGRDFRRSRHGAHVIFFVDAPDHIRIVRILHQRRNFAAQLRDET
ncbi:MAG: type II toxin-antitoxin system RelE/ParE family toxin [Allosphingosinicella sp.]